MSWLKMTCAVPLSKSLLPDTACKLIVPAVSVRFPLKEEREPKVTRVPAVTAVVPLLLVESQRVFP